MARIASATPRQITNSANVSGDSPADQSPARQWRSPERRIWPGNRNHSSQPISIQAPSRYTSPIKSLVYRCGSGNNAGLALRRSIAGCDVRRRRAADHEVSCMTCLLNNAVFRTLRHEPARGALRWLPPASLAPVCLALATFTAAAAAGSHARAASPRKERAAAVSTASRPGGAPIMAIVSLRSQGITVYDTAGWIMRAPVSSGQSGRETPAGVFSVLQKDADHHSNLYDDAWMPHMHRLTWSGIALHGGPLPGYAASHGCVRLPYDFASRLFDMTKVGMRVIISPGDVAPVEITHPALPPSNPVSAAAAAARAAEAAAAAGKADQAKRAVDIASWAAAQAAAPVHAAETLKQKAETQLAAA